MPQEHTQNKGKHSESIKIVFIKQIPFRFQ